jgi:formamidopyrimidine-DNA glycosylase
MPELPEVETVVRTLRAFSLIGKTLTSVKFFCPKFPQTLQTLVGHPIQQIERRGKYIHFVFSSSLHLIIHLRMTGRFLLKPEGEFPARHERVIFYFNDFQVAFHDTRRFATFDVTTEPNQIFSRLGFEPLDPHFFADQFIELLSFRDKPIKVLLLDQSLIAGIGNIYADEALWEAKIHPQRLASSLSQKEAIRLFEAIRLVLMNGIKNGGTSLGKGAPNFHHLNGQSGYNQETLKAYGREGKRCYRCGNQIKRIVLHLRSTHFCPACQSLE